MHHPDEGREILSWLNWHLQSLRTLLGTPVHLLIHAIILIANRVAAVQNHADTGQELQIMFSSNIGMGKKFDWCDFDRGMIVGVRKGGLSISETADLWGFYARQNINHPVSSCSAGKNTVLMRGPRKMARLVKVSNANKIHFKLAFHPKMKWKYVSAYTASSIHPDGFVKLWQIF